MTFLEKEKMIEKEKETKLKKYSNYNNFEKIKSILLKKYSVTSYFSNKDFKQKAENTKLKKYGNKNFNNHKQYVQTCLKKYGVESTNQIKEIVEKQQRNNHYNYLYENQIFNSYPELCFYIFEKDHGKNIIRNPSIFEYFDNLGKLHFYHPDFLDEGRYIEIKGDHLIDKNGQLYNPYKKLYLKEKQKCMEIHNVILIKAGECSQYIKYCEDTYGKDFKLNFKKGVS